jgi:hypothetical protein
MRRNISRVMTPVPEPSSTTLQALRKSTCSSIAMASDRELGNTEAVTRMVRMDSVKKRRLAKPSEGPGFGE